VHICIQKLYLKRYCLTFFFWKEQTLKRLPTAAASAPTRVKEGPMLPTTRDHKQSSIFVELADAFSCHTRVCTVVLVTKKSRTLELLAFDEKSTFDFFALFARIKRGAERPRGRVNCQNHARAPRGRDACRKSTEIYGNPRAYAARTLWIYFLVSKNTVLNLVYYSMCAHEHVLNLVHTVGVDALPIIKKNALSAGPETRRKRSVCLRASQCSIERVPYLIFDKVMGIWKSTLLYGDCMKLGCIGKSNTNNRPYSRPPESSKSVYRKNQGRGPK
jgi:hypothetical protein